MRTLNTSETRAINGGFWKCSRCGKKTVLLVTILAHAKIKHGLSTKRAALVVNPWGPLH